MAGRMKILSSKQCFGKIARDSNMVACEQALWGDLAAGRETQATNMAATCGGREASFLWNSI